ncbi:hypothetical protein CFC21_034723 [Triticum aestivum]|uniref:DUF547 domain-containing protein n=3 Tax=Triticum TaxID=4564 RepID=A0A9R0REZ4_TRITD|nr:uncharacterized protein LOC119267602 [Triticum dicoccoides]XP_037404919.1 uncharacterized protein LOC119267602 [Triticum dicoccoides]XP_037404920.1 uncharacterized protein LOC119267602 [Triticum dicoccoides]XP_044339477.1 uncharacterized protein LOC123060718 isoform X2 [Triticum aestivum]VAH59105.1 unnamed protein product [Triticum turgidum subsp. durum]KAF7021837.1 hypothetical protein CFC21_034723 [Triticum aestivum]
MAAAQQGNVEQAVNGAQEPGKVGGEAPEAASAPKAAAAATAAAPHHRRSKSASSGRNLETCKHVTMEQRFNQAQNPPDPRKSSCSTDGSSVHRAPPRDQRTSTATASPNHRVSLENDVSQLQLHLHQERSIRIMLDRAIGRASSTLSPGHRHFPAQTKELIAEIELLEEEIANREQHVLSLYRSIFDQCVSGPSSGQSSGISSPAHAKSISSRTRRRQSSIISSAFCSSKKLPLQPFHIMTSVSESGRTKNMLKTKIKHESFSSETLDVRPASLASDPRKLPYSGSSSLARTLKDHLYQCPSKISEEMVRCMASIYCLLRTESPEKPEKVRSPFLSRSSTSVILPRRGNGEETNPSSNKSIVEVCSITVEENQTPDVSCAITHYRLLVEQLERVDLSISETSIKLAFWINVYNSLVMHAYLAYGIPNSSLKRMALFHKAAYNVGGYAVTANSIEHSLLCCRSPRIGRWFESILSTAMRKRCADEKQLVQLKFGLPDCQPQALFALCTGASSDPTLKVYTAKNVTEELERAKREFLQAGVVVRKSRKVFLPRLVERYAKEAGLPAGDGVLAWTRDNLDGRAAQEAIQRCAAAAAGAGGRRRASQAFEWLPYNARFRYAFARSMVDKQAAARTGS